MNAHKSSDQQPGKGADTVHTQRQKEAQPEWANGLRKLYDSVVEEPLPDTFRDLLSQLDAKD